MEGSNTWNLNVTEEDEYNTELMVHNFHPSLTKQGLSSQFLRFGRVDGANVMVNSRGNPVGFVRMRTVGECDRAIAGLNGKAPLHWTVKMSAPQAERLRRRREREDARRFEEETQPLVEARLKEMEQHQQRMLQLTREFRDTLEAEQQQQQPREADVAEQPDQDNSGTPVGASTPIIPSLEGLRPCTLCAAPTPGYCQACDQPYCSTSCQRQDWQRHKHQCRRQLSLVVSVGSGEQSQKEVRSVTLGRGDQPRPTPDPAPVPLRRPHHATVTGQTSITTGAGGDGPVPATAPRQQGSFTRRPHSAGVTGQQTGGPGPAGGGAGDGPPPSTPPRQQGAFTRRPGELRDGQVQGTPTGQQGSFTRRPYTAGGTGQIASPVQTSRGAGDGPTQTTPPRQPDAFIRRPGEQRGGQVQGTPPGQQDAFSRRSGQQQSSPVQSTPPRQQGALTRRPGESPMQGTPRQQSALTHRLGEQRNSPTSGPSPRQTRKQQQLQSKPQHWHELGPVTLRPGQHYAVMVCYAADPGAVNLRLVDQYDLVQEMEEELGQRVTPASAAGTRGLELGQLCAARFEGSWYRGEIRAAANPDYQIHFIDWGNTDSIPATDVAVLPARLADIPPQAVMAALPWRPAGADGSWSQRQWEGLQALNGRPLTASVVATEPTVSVSLFNEDGKSVLSVMGPARSQTEAEPTLPEQAQLEYDRKHIVAPCLMQHPQLVCAQLRDAALYRPYQALTESLQTTGSSAPPLPAIPPDGSPVLVLCGALTGPPAWHRAAVEGRHGERAVVRLLDWGRRETVELEHIRRMPQHLCQIPAIGVQFGLHGITETACAEEELAFYRDKLIGKEFLLERVNSDGERVQARLHLLNDQNSFCFNEKMLNRIAGGRVGRPALPASAAPLSPSAASPLKRFRLANESSAVQPLTLADLAGPTIQCGDSFPFLIGQALGPGRFHGSPLTEEHTAAMDRLELELQEAMAARPPPACRAPLQTGQLLAVRSDVDPDGWSRAAVVDPSGPEVLVRLLDAGYQERVALERLHPLPAEVTRLSPASLLLSFRGSERWSNEQRRLALKLLRGDGDGETVLELTVAAVGSAGTATLVTCPALEVG